MTFSNFALCLFDASGNKCLGVEIWQETSIAKRTKAIVKVAVLGQHVEAKEHSRLVNGNLTTIRFLLKIPKALSSKVDKITQDNIKCEVKHVFE